MQINRNLRPGRSLHRRDYQKKESPVISIITPVYEEASYLKEVAYCVLNQTFPYFEWILVDDGSTNKETLKILDEVEKMDERISLYHKKNEGPSVARDFGVSCSKEKAEYLLFLDADDLIDKTFLETAYFAMKTYPDASFCYGDTIAFADQEYVWQKQFDSNRMKVENLLTLTALIKKEDFLAVDGFNVKEARQYEDWNLWLKLLALKKYPIHMSYFTFWYRKINNHGELSRANKNKKNAMKLIKDTRKKIQEFVPAVEFPRENFYFDTIVSQVPDLVIPKYSKDKKSHVLVFVPWMTLGGADQFNLDLFTLLPHDKYFITLVSMQPTPYEWRQKFEEVCDEVFDLSTFLDRQYFSSFIEYLIESRNVDLLLNTNSTTGYMLLPLIRSFHPNLPIMDYIHMEEWYNRRGGYSRDSMGVTSVIDKTLFCNQNSERIMHEYFHVPKEKLGTVYIGIDAQKFDPSLYDKEALRKKYQIPEGKKVISFLARIDYQKRPFLLIEIIRAFLQKRRDFVFVVAGDGKLLTAVQKKARQYGIEEAILFLGKTDLPAEIYAISDITLNCSIKEGLALTSYESLAMGVPVVSSDVGGQKELIDEETGVIVPCLQKEDDVYELTYSSDEVMNYVVGLEKIAENLNKYQKNCRKRILEHFTIQKMSEKMDQEFQTLLQKKKSHLALDGHQELGKELLVQYFMQEKKIYQWYCEEYRLACYGTKKVPTGNKKEAFLQKLEWYFRGFFGKIHFLEEAIVLSKILYQILRQVKRLVVAIFFIPIWILYFIYKFISLLILKVVRKLRRKV